MTGLVLTAGGARGAYQAGVLKRVSELRALRGRPAPFRIITGASAGAINGAALAAYHSDFTEGAVKLATLWAQLTAADVFRTDLFTFARTGTQLMLDMVLGRLTGSTRTHGLVNTAPLRAFLGRHLPMDAISRAIEGGLYALAITATGYHSGKAFTFIQGKPGHAVWNKSRRVALPTALSLDHILASAAIPLVFPPVALSVASGSTAYFGDGALRLTTPLSPAIRLGAKRLFAIGVRCQEAADSLLRSELSDPGGLVSKLRSPPLSQICGVFMNAIFLDHLDADLDHLKRMNELVAASKISTGAAKKISEPMSVIEPLVISPSADIAIIAKTLEHRMPRTLRYVLDGLGTPDAQSADLTSFLLFDKAFTSELIQLGYRDAAQRIDEIEQFLLRT
jgi:NTE family protein